MECGAFSTGRFQPDGQLAGFDKVNAVGGVSLIEEPRTGSELNRLQGLPPNSRLADFRREPQKRFGGFPAPWTRPSAGAEFAKNIAGEVPLPRLTQAILRKSVMRPMGSHSATRMSPLLRKIAPWGVMNLPGVNSARDWLRREPRLPFSSIPSPSWAMTL